MSMRRGYGSGDAFLLGSQTGDRRRACRYPVVFQDTLLGWWQNAHFVTVSAHLIDLSTNGCFAEVPRSCKLTTSQSVWVRPHSSSPAAWAEARIISVRTPPLFGPCKLRISFLVPFEYEMFKKLVYGPDHLRDVTQSEVQEHEKDEFWKMSRGLNDPPDA